MGNTWRWHAAEFERDMAMAELEYYRTALKKISLGQVVNPQGYAMLVLDDKRTTHHFHRPGSVGPE